MERRNVKGKSLIVVAAIALVMMFASVLIKNAFFAKRSIEIANNEQQIEAAGGNNVLTSELVISQACKLLGTPYGGGLNSGVNGKGVTGNPWSGSYGSFQEPNDIRGIDCSGLIYWSLGSLGVTSSNFYQNNPIPMDTFGWKGWATSQGRTTLVNSKVDTSNWKINYNGKAYAVTALKNQDVIGDNGLRYYEYGEKGQYLPAGVVIISAGNQLSGLILPDGSSVRTRDDHAWLTLGYLNTDDPKEVANYLKTLGVDESKLVVGYRQGDIIVDEQGNDITSTATVIKEGDCKYWRIEAKGGQGVIVDNGDPDAETVTVNGVGKAMGPIYAFHFTEEVKGDYVFSINKTDENGNILALTADTFRIYRNDELLSNNDYIISGNKIVITKDLTKVFEGASDNFVVEENVAPEGYVKYEKIIAFDIKTEYNPTLGKKVGVVDPDTFYINEIKQNFVNGEYQFDGGQIHLNDIDLSGNKTGDVNLKVKNKKLAGKYDLSIYKTDASGKEMNGAKFTVKSISNNSNNTFEGNWETKNLIENESSFTLKDNVEINSVDTKDVYEIVETQAPAGYIGLNKKIVLLVEKEIKDNKYVISNVKVYAFDSNEEVSGTALANDTNLIGTANNFGTENEREVNYDVDGKTFNVVLPESDSVNSSIKVFVQNKFVDLALKKTITKVDNIDVSKANSFNTGRLLSELGNAVRDLTAEGVDLSPLETSTNASYYMNKKPVEVAAGQKIEYSIKVFNEGQVRARASKIADYIPNGLKVIGVKYDDSDLVANTDYTYDEAKGVLNIDLTNKGQLTYPRTNGRIFYDEVIVICEVKDNATGVLTNVAEITEYMDENGVIEKDIDSTPNNWNAPNNESKLENTKDSSSWREYNTNPNADEWDYDYLAQDTGLNGNKGDDDDFDKVIVANDKKYTLTIRKINAQNEEAINDVLFNITKTVNHNDGTAEEISTLNNVNFVDEKIVQDVTFNELKSGKVTYILEEVKNADNKYIQIEGKIKVDVDIVPGKIDHISVYYAQKDSDNYTLLTPSGVRQGGCELKIEGVNVQFGVTNDNVVAIIPNKVITNSKYGLRLRKISSGNRSALAGVEFSGTENNSQLTFDATDANGYTNQITKDITLDNYETTDSYVINEINLGSNQNYTKLNKSINVDVKKELTKTGELKLKEFDIYVDGSEITLKDTNVSDTINVTDANGIKYTIEAKVEAINDIKTLTLTVPNAPDTTVGLKLVKVNKNDESPIAGTGFSIYKYGTSSLVYNGETVATTDGILVDDKIEAGTRTIEYEIYEDYAAAGFVNTLADKVLKLTVQETDGVVQSAEVKVLNKDENRTEADDQTLATATVQDGRAVVKIANPPVEKDVDLALKKVITKIDGHEVKANSTHRFGEIYERTTEGKMRIDTTPLQNGGHDAEYYLNKTPILVVRGSKVTYDINIYNEGKVDATAGEIVDFLPNDMKFDRVLYKGQELTAGTDYTYNENTNTLRIKVLANKELIPHYDATENKLHSETVTVECTVKDSAKSNYNLTNIAEITQYIAKDINNNSNSVIDTDIDSTAGNWSYLTALDYYHKKITSDVAERYDRSGLNWANYIGLLVGERTNTFEEGVFKNYLGEEDDDDFEKVRVIEVDLALKKIITQVGNKTENTFGEGFTRFQDVNGEREVKTDVRALTRLSDVTDAEYYLNKTPITVAIGDTISYQIRIYNEGSINATASEIKDYIPKGLEFESIYSSDGTELTTGFDYNRATNVLTITSLKDNFIEYYKGNASEQGQIPPEYNYVTVKCRVTGAVTGVLTNVAEISEYQTEFGTTTRDVDSQTTGEGEWKAPEGTNKETLEGKSSKDWADYYDGVEEGKFNNYPGQQDDDDFEKIMVIGYRFKVKKFSDWARRGLSNVTFKVNGQEYVTDENGIIDFGWQGMNSDNTVAGEYNVEEISADGYEMLERAVSLKLKQSIVEGQTVISSYELTFGEAEPFEIAVDGNHHNYIKYIDITKGQYMVLNIDKDENGCYEIQLEFSNRHKDLDYELYIRKVDSLQSNQGIGGSRFTVESFKMNKKQDDLVWRLGMKESFETRDDGLVKVSKTKLNIQEFILAGNNETYDIYKIEEAETPYNYFKIADDQDIYLTVNKKATTDENGNYTGIKVDSIKLTLNRGTEDEVSTEAGKTVTLENVKLEKQIKTVDIKAQLIEVTNDETGEVMPTIIVTVPNVKKEFDLSLRKHIIEDKEKFSVNRWSMPQVNAEGILNGSATTAIYNNAKEPAIEVERKDIVRYGIRVYNEGELGGYAEVVKDDIPEGLEMIAPEYDDNGMPLNTNAMYRWVMLDKDGNETNDVTKAECIVSDFLSKAHGEELLPEGSIQENPFYMIAFDTNTMTSPVSREVQVEFKVKDTAKEGEVIINKAQISKHSDEFGNTSDDGVIDRDSTPDVWEPAPRDDDQDTEKIVVLRDKIYDLALRKFITKVNGEEIANSREPQVDCRNLVAGGHDADYYHTKDPVLVNQNDIVDYTLRIYNEGKDDAYAETIYDDVPADTEFVQPLYDENGKPLNLNAEYGWRMYRKATEEEIKELENVESKNILVYDDVVYIPTEKAEEAVLVATDYLSMGNGADKNLIKAFNPAIGQMTVENYRDIKLQFKVKEQENISEEKIIINYAQIAKMLGEGGNPVIDIDSTPGKWIDTDDDQDIEQLKLGKFDLALYKWVSTAIVTENGKTTQYESGHNQADKTNLVNVSIPKNSLNKVSVKFKYQLKVENQGSIPGKALEIKDHIPAGLKFVEEDNKEFRWVAVDDKTIVTDYLKDTELKPGESTEVTVVLTWINGSENFGTKVNYAEISKDYNDLGWPDIDSTPDNFTGKPQEDDEDEDEVKLTIRTGVQSVVYVVIGVAVMAIVAGGVLGIKKFVVSK